MIFGLASYNVILMDTKLMLLWCNFRCNFNGRKIDATSAYFFVALFFSYTVVVLISLFDTFLTILKTKVAWTSLLMHFCFVALLQMNFSITKYVGLERYVKTRTTNERNKFSNARVFLNFWVIYFQKTRALLQGLN